MKKEKAILISAVFALTAIVAAVVEIRTHAQSPTSPVTQSPAPTTQSPMPALPDTSNPFDIQGRSRYLVGPGDLLDVRVFGQPDLNSTVEIDEEGNISSLPFLDEPIPAMCHTEKDIQKAIAKAYSKYLKGPRVSVLVRERRSRPPAVVFGAVRAPTRIQMMRRVRLHELLVAAGGVTLGASGKIQIVHTEREMCPQDSIPTPDIADGLSSSTFEKAALTEKTNAPVMSPVSNNATSTATASSTASKPPAVSSFAGQQQDSKPVPKTDDKADASEAIDVSGGKKPLMGPLDIGRIDTYEIDTVRNGVGSTDPYIRPGDIVIVTEGEPIYLTGYFNAPREIVMKDNMTLVRAVAMAGGLQKLAKSTIYIYRQVKGKVGPDKMMVDFNAIREGKKPDMPLQAYDIIDARPQSSFSAENLRQLFLGIGKSTVGGVGGSLPYRILY
ncbi:MAG TPA: polysaccharide biosynthesis/export family protein [Pyrinomonadaceae bacterium]|nr:polysaccharide biosynthesis/export family protein [Pyrinomonadaceae bacterium]